MTSDGPGDADRWARDLIRAVGKRQARGVLEDYRAIAADVKVTKTGRDIAAQRAKTLAASPGIECRFPAYSAALPRHSRAGVSLPKIQRRPASCQLPPA